MQVSFGELKKNLKKDYTGLPVIKIALLGDSATQLLAQAIKGMGYNDGLHYQVWEADFNQIERQVFDTGSELYSFAPDVVIIFYASHKLLNKYNKSTNRSQFAQQQLNNLTQLQQQISHHLSAKLICFNYPEIDDNVFGNYANKYPESFLYQVRQLNLGLMDLAIQQPSLAIYDLASLQNRMGKNFLFQSSIYINTEMVIAIDALPYIANGISTIIKTQRGQVKKCVILDLDNTLWGGIIGDDGLENIQLGSLGIGKAFTEFQWWLKKLQQRGIILAVCSKNNEATAREPFEKHPDMVLRLDDIAVFVANWQNKADNIRHIQSILNIGFDSMVFLDDNPFERNIVRENIAGITVPELPEDPAEYLEYLYTQQLFETTVVSAMDSERTKQYQVEAQRAVMQQAFANEGDFLKSLNMVSTIEPFTPFNTPRVAQLSQRSNQFNLRTIRYAEEDISQMATNPTCFPFTFTLQDKFGDNGLIAIVIMQKETDDTLFINTWLMSCRVLKRGMEDFTLNTIAAFAIANGYQYLKGEYIATPKNEMVKDHYQKLGFEPNGGYWILDTATWTAQPTYITANSLIHEQN
jgi:FkbH-like protein